MIQAKKYSYEKITCNSTTQKDNKLIVAVLVILFFISLLVLGNIIKYKKYKEFNKKNNYKEPKE